MLGENGGIFVRKYLLLVSAVVTVASVWTAPKLAEASCAGCRVGSAAGYPGYYVYDGIIAPTYYYGGYYTSRVVFAPVGGHYSPYGPLVRYRNVRRAW